MQSKREMFFKPDAPTGGTGAPVTHPSTAPPAPPITNNSLSNSTPASGAPGVPASNTGPQAPSSVTSTSLASSTAITSSHTTTSSSTSIASIKEQLLTTKHKEEDNKEVNFNIFSRSF